MRSNTAIGTDSGETTIKDLYLYSVGAWYKFRLFTNRIDKVLLGKC